MELKAGPTHSIHHPATCLPIIPIEKPTAEGAVAFIRHIASVKKPEDIGEAVGKIVGSAVGMASHFPTSYVGPLSVLFHRDSPNARKEEHWEEPSGRPN